LYKENWTAITLVGPRQPSRIEFSIPKLAAKVVLIRGMILRVVARRNANEKTWKREEDRGEYYH
jgi:hypothetical protein